MSAQKISIEKTRKIITERHKALLERACSDDNEQSKNAQLLLAEIYSSEENQKILGIQNKKEGFKIAKAWCDSAIQFGSTPAKTKLAILLEKEYEHFDFTKKQGIKLAQKQYLSAAKENDSTAQNNLGNLYITNYKLLGISELTAGRLAHKWIKKACESEKLGDFFISKNLAKIYRQFYYERSFGSCIDVSTWFLKKIEESGRQKDDLSKGQFMNYFQDYLHAQRQDVLISSIDKMINDVNISSNLKNIRILYELIDCRDNGVDIIKFVRDENERRDPQIKKFFEDYRKQKSNGGLGLSQ